MKANYNNIERETEKAIFVNFTCGRSGWMPKSIVTIDASSKTIEIPDWKARDLKIDEKSIAREEREMKSLRNDIEKREQEMTEAEKNEIVAFNKHVQMFNKYDAKRGEYYTIDAKTGRRIYG